MPLLPDLTPWASEADSYIYGWTIQGDELRLTTAMANIGEGALEVRGGHVHAGQGGQDVYQRVYNADGTHTDYLAGTFEYHEGHGHIHFEDFAHFRLRSVTANDGVGDIVSQGEKVSFCLIDVDQHSSDAGARTYSSCGQIQGVSAGWADVYHRGLPGQSIDISSVPDGTYWLEVEVDPLNQLIESDETNNVTRIQITLDRGGTGPTPGDAFEDNDSMATAAVLAPPEDHTYEDLSIHQAGDDDYYRVTAASTGDMTFSLAFNHAAGDIDMEVFDAAGARLDRSVSTSDAESVTVTAAEGDYFFVRVYGYNGATNNYTMFVDQPERIDAYEPNDTFATSALLTTVGAETSFHDLSIHAGDQDYFKFAADGSGQLKVHLDFHHDDGDINGRILDAAGNVVTASSRDGSHADPDHEHLQFEAVDGETYYINIFGADAQVSNPYYSIKIDQPQPPVGPQLTITPPSDIDEGDAGESGQVVFAISLDQAAAVEVTADVTISGGATGPSAITIPAGETSTDITLAFQGDDVDESDETISVTLSNLQGATPAGPLTASAQILDDDGPLPDDIFTAGDDAVDLNTFNLALYSIPQATEALGGNDTVTLSETQNIGVTVKGGGDDDVIFGSSNDDSIEGNAGNDDLYGFDGDDTLDGGAGSDEFIGGLGADTLIGGGDDDFFYNVETADTVIEAAGSGSWDTVFAIQDWSALADQGIEAIRANAGTTGLALTGNNLTNYIFGGDGDDTLSGGGEFDFIEGGDGNDILNGDGGSDALYGQAGDDTINGGANTDDIYGGLGNDTLSGNDGDDFFYDVETGDTVFEAIGGGSWDTVYAIENWTMLDDQEIEALRANAGNIGLELTGNNLTNYIYGGDGDDTLNGAGEYDFITGGDGNDTINGGDDTGDLLLGDAGDDTINGGAGNDDIYGGTGADIMNGGADSDFYYGVETVDQIIEAAETGSWDTVYAAQDWTAGAGQEIEAIRADAGATGIALTGNDLTNYIFGGDGDDTLNGGGSAFDVLTGGAGSDTFVMQDNSGVDRIEDFEKGVDQIDLSQLTGLNSFAQLAISASGPDTLIEFGTVDIYVANPGAVTLDTGDIIV